MGSILNILNSRSVAIIIIKSSNYNYKNRYYWYFLVIRKQKSASFFCDIFHGDICVGIVGIMLSLKYSKSFPSLFRHQIETNKIGGSQTKTLINYPATAH